MSGAFTVAVDGAVLSGECKGEGPPLILVHGMAGDRHEWDRLLAALPPALATLRYDLRGFGCSQTQDVAFSHADDLLALLDARRIERAPIVGLSMGGAIALNFALDHPERVSRLALISPAMIGWDASDEWKALWRSVTEAARRGDLPLARQRWFDHPMFAVLRQDAILAAELRQAIEAYHGRQWIHDWQRNELPDVDRLHRLAVPTILLTGERDHADLRLVANLISAAAPGVRRIDYPGAGHMLHLERTRQVAAEIANFAE
jgi:pimeloyl-ACP methyl ester carboxylesterase